VVFRHRPTQARFRHHNPYGPDGPLVKQARVPNSALQLERYVTQFPGPHRAVVESTGAWYWLADTLAALGVDLVLAHLLGVRLR